MLRKGKRFERKPEHTKAMKKLKKTLRRVDSLKKPSYDRPIIVTIDTSPTGIGWVINQADSDGSRYPIRFGAKVLNKRKRGYAQVKRELWGSVSAIKAVSRYSSRMRRMRRDHRGSWTREQMGKTGMSEVEEINEVEEID